MQGKIISVFPGLILGDDGNRYAFTTDEWQDEDEAPAYGMRIDFEVRGSDAADIFPIPVGVPTPPAAPEASPAGPASAPRTVSDTPRPQPAPAVGKRLEVATDTQEIRQEIRNVERRVVARIDRTERQMTARFDSSRNRGQAVNIVGVEVSFGELFGIFFKAMPAYILAVLVWLVLIVVILGLLAAGVYMVASS